MPEALQRPRSMSWASPAAPGSAGEAPRAAQRELDLPEKLSANALLDVLNALYPRPSCAKSQVPFLNYSASMQTSRMA